jgi:Flp pilus assembly protein TadD
MSPYSAEAYYGRGLAYRSLGRAEDAAADLEKATQLDPRMAGQDGANHP